MSDLRDELTRATSDLCVVAQILDVHLGVADDHLEDCDLHREAVGRFRAAVARFEAAQRAYILDGLRSLNAEAGA
jgi:hypothetical protein